jgi:phosphoribosylamine-glycine ligase
MKKIGKIKALVVIGTGISQALIIKNVIKLGYYAIGIDQDKNSPGVKLCNYFIHSSTYDYANIGVELLRLNKEYNITGVINRSSGPPVVTAAKIFENLGIPGYSVNAAKIIINKHILSEYCINHSIPCPKTYHYSSMVELDSKNINYPCIVKPSLSIVGKDGVYKVKNKKKLPDLAERALSASYNSVAVLQEYIKGKDITLFSYIDKRKLVKLFILEEVNHVDDYHKVNGRAYIIPSSISGTDIEDEIVDISKRIVKNLEIERTLFIASFRICNGKPALIEIHLDMGGQLFFEKLFPTSIDFDIVPYLIKILAGDIYEIPEMHTTPVAVVYSKEEPLNAEENSVTITANSISGLYEKL